jgi:hypothetical protein
MVCAFKNLKLISKILILKSYTWKNFHLLSSLREHPKVFCCLVHGFYLRFLIGFIQTFKLPTSL